MRDYSLGSEQLYELHRAHRRTKIKREADKIKAVYLLGKGWTVISVCEALLLDDDTVRSYFQRYQEGGLSELLKDHYQGNEGRLTMRELSDLEQHLRTTTYRTVKEILAYVDQEYEVDYSASGMTELLHRLGFVYKKPKRLPAKAEEQAQENFVKNYRRIRRAMSAEDHLYFIDGVHPHYNPVVSYGWIKKGEEKALKTTGWQPRLNINGAVNIDTLQMSVKYESTMNIASTKELLKSLRGRHLIGKIIVICDRAKYYHNQEIKAYAKKLNVRMVYLPPYSPNLNLIERVWLYMKKMVLYNNYYKTFKEFEGAVRGFFRNIHRHKSDLQSLLVENFQKLCFENPKTIMG